MRVVAVLQGGTSSEREVSLWTGERVLQGLDRRRYRPVSVVIEREGGWTVDGSRRDGPLGGMEALGEHRPDVFFLALHGPAGEDGTMQGFLDTLGIPYTGSGVAGSALAADKVRAKRLVGAAGFPVPTDLLVPPADAAEVEARLGYPVFVKNPHGGSSLEVRPAAGRAELESAIEELSAGCGRLLVESTVPGREITVAVLDDQEGRPQALPVAEIRSRGGFFDFRNKYTRGVAEEIVPAPIDTGIARRVRDATVEIHRLLDLSGMSRSDWILREDGTAVYLETNTIPGLTPTSLLPQAALAAGIEFPDVLTRLVESALRSAGRATMGPWSASSGRSGARSTGSSTGSTAARSSS